MIYSLYGSVEDTLAQSLVIHVNGWAIWYSAPFRPLENTRLMTIFLSSYTITSERMPKYCMDLNLRMSGVFGLIKFLGSAQSGVGDFVEHCYSDLISAIQTENISHYAMPRHWEKAAERMVIELKDKVQEMAGAPTIAEKINRSHPPYSKTPKILYWHLTADTKNKKLSEGL